MSKSKPRNEIPQSVRFNVLRRDNFVCRYCGKGSPEVELHLDHVKPFSKGGECTEENLVTACADCNLGKNAKEGVSVPTAEIKIRGLVGFFGHKLIDKKINYQFQILRKISETHYAVQLFSYFDGGPTNLAFYSEADLCGDEFVLYATNDDMLTAYEKFCQKEKWERRSA